MTLEPPIKGPRAAELKKIESMDTKLLEVLRNHITPLQENIELQINTLLLAASRLRHSWPQAAMTAINEVADHPTLAKRIRGSNYFFHLKVAQDHSAFVTPRH
jgi:hypothetical protein